MKGLFGQVGRLFWREILQLFFLLVICFFGLFVLIDYSSRAHGMPLKGMQWLFYYGALFIHRMDLLVPFGLLIAVVRTVCQANERYQITAMMASGISLQRLLSPCLCIGLLFTGLLYGVDVKFWAKSSQGVRQAEDKRLQNKLKREGTQRVHSLVLKDGSLILYRAYLSSEERMLDVYWVQSINALYRMESMHIGEKAVEGTEVSYWERNPEGQFIETQMRSHWIFPEMQLDEALLNQVRVAPIDRSLVDLWRDLPAIDAVKTQESNRIESAWYRRLSMPWLCFLACVGPLPWCVRFRRHMPLMLLYSLFLAALGLLYVVHHALSILADNGLLPAREALLGTILFFVLAALVRFMRMRSG